MQGKLKIEDILVRCSSLGDVITKSGNFTDTAKKACVKLFASQGYGRYDDINSKYLKKGLTVEEDAITIYSVVTKEYFIKNQQRLSDRFITGEWDLHDSIKKIEHITDIKSSYNLPSFLANKIADVKWTNYWQGVGYMRLTGAKRYTVANCLVNNTAEAINKEKLYKSYEQGMLDKNGNESPEYIEICKKIERKHIFDIPEFKKQNPYFDWHNTIFDFDIPKELRIIKFDFDRNEDDIKRIESEVIKVRKFLFETYKEHFE